jgi:hypothetical protein
VWSTTTGSTKKSNSGKGFGWFCCSASSFFAKFLDIHFYGGVFASAYTHYVALHTAAAFSIEKIYIQSNNKRMNGAKKERIPTSIQPTTM